MLAALTLAIAPSCSDDDNDPLKPLTEVSVDNTQSAYNSLTFAWNKVSDARQYGYEMYDNNGSLVIRSVTDQTEVTVSGLEAATEYTMKVWAYAAIGSGLTSSEPAVIKASTAPLRILDAPTLEYEIVAKRYVFSWSSVTDAEGYSYTLVNSDGEIVKSADITSRSAVFTGLDKGEYTFNLNATTTVEGYEKTGATTSYTFTVS